MSDKRQADIVSGKQSRSLFRDCAGSTAIEYALIAAGISIAIVASVNGVGSQVVGLFTTVANLF